MYNEDLVRQLCGKIAAEQDPARASELASLLQAVIRDDVEEIKTRIAFLTKKYAGYISDSNAAD